VAWTVDDRADMQMLIDLGYNAIVTNCLNDLLTADDGRATQINADNR